MATVTGDIAIDATGLPDANPFTDPAITAVGAGVQVLNGAFKSPSTTIGGFVTSASPSGQVVRSTVELVDIASNDPCGPLLLNASGNGYWLRCNFSEVRPYKVTNFVAAGSRLGGATNATVAAFDQVSMQIDEATGTITTYHNGALLETLVDTDYTGTKAGFYSVQADSNQGGAASWGATGYAAAGPSITPSDPVVDGAEATITASGLTGDITATLGGYPLALAGTLPNLTYTTDIASITVNGPVSAPRIGESLTLSVTGDEGEATSAVDFNPPTGRAAVTLSGTLSNETDSLIDKMQNVSGLTVAVPDVMYYPTADNTDITTAGFLTSDSPSFTLILIKGGDADTAGSAYAFTVTPEAVTPVDPGTFPITRSVLKSVTRSITKSIYRG